jgi:non-ribosomal peptide synthetase-like protein
VNRIGRRSFVGNNAILPIGSHLGDRCLLGVLSATPADFRQTPDGTEWLGSPAFRLPYRQKVGGFEDSVTYRPTPKLYVQRCLIDALRIFIPNYIAGAGWLAFIGFLVFIFSYLPLWAIFVFTPPLAFGIAVGVALCVVAVKRLLMPPFRPVIKPLWSTYVWWNEVITGAYETVAAPVLAPLMGTPFFNWYLRLLGCKIGKHVFLETGLFSEFDLVDIGDYAALNLGAVAQNHLFEDRIMKSSFLRIGDDCSVGNMSVVLYDTEMQQGASIGPLSLLMKGETLPPFTRWLGIPTSETTAVKES